MLAHHVFFAQQHKSIRASPSSPPEHVANDLNFGITTYVNGTEMNPVQLDTSEAATDTIDYVVTDENGLTATSTRTVIILPTGQAGESPPIVPEDENASSTQATSTSP